MTHNVLKYKRTYGISECQQASKPSAYMDYNHSQDVWVETVQCFKTHSTQSDDSQLNIQTNNKYLL